MKNLHVTFLSFEFDGFGGGDFDFDIALLRVSAWHGRPRALFSLSFENWMGDCPELQLGILFFRFTFTGKERKNERTS